MGTAPFIILDWLHPTPFTLQTEPWTTLNPELLTHTIHLNQERLSAAQSEALKRLHSYPYTLHLNPNPHILNPLWRKAGLLKSSR